MMARVKIHARKTMTDFQLMLMAIAMEIPNVGALQLEVNFGEFCTQETITQQT